MSIPPTFPITVPLGAGGQPAGLSPAGTGIRATGQVAIPVVFPDPLSGLSDTGRIIDPRTGDFDFTALGLASGQATMPQIVALVAADLDFSSLDVAGSDLTQNVLAIVQTAFALYVNRGLMAIVSIVVTPIGSGATISGVRVDMRWRDLTGSQQQDQVTNLF